MPEITLEKTHALLEKLAEYVMNEVPTKREVDARFNQVDERFQKVYDAIWELKEEKADKKDIEIIQQKLDKILKGMDSQIKQLDIIRTEQYATSATLDRHEHRLDALEAS